MISGLSNNGSFIKILLVILAFPCVISSGQADPDSIRNQAGLSPALIIQIGAFRLEQNALALKSRLSTGLQKPVIIVTEDGYFKVRVTGFESPEEIDNIVPALGLLGIKNLWILRVEDPEDVKPQITAEVDSVATKAGEKDVQPPPPDEEIPLTIDPAIALQAGVFHRRSKAFRAQRRITARLKLPAEIIQEWEYYKVIIPGFHSTQETHEYYPRLAKIGYPDILLIENYH
jgi:cell division protein FtsN